MNNKIDNIEYERIRFEGNIHLITSDEQLKNYAQEINSAKELGFDTETRPSFKKGDNYKMALLQLSTEKDAYLIRLHFINDFKPIKSALENENITKVGLAIRDDIKGLQKIFPFEAKSFVELQDLAKKLGLKNFGLKGMTEEVLNVTLSKKAKLTNWEIKSLSSDQLTYAATDAWIGLKLFKKLQSL